MDEVMLSAEAFAAWLANKGDSWVGRACDAEGCPLAFWLADMYGGRWSVGPAGYACVEGAWAEYWGVLPAWARRFYWAVDRWFASLGMVAACDALALLREIGGAGNG